MLLKKSTSSKMEKNPSQKEDQKLLFKEMKGFVLNVLGLTLDGNPKDNRLNPVMDLVLGAPGNKQRLIKIGRPQI